MKIDIKRECKRFIENYDFNEDLALRTEKPHLARWAYGACEEWIRDFQGNVSKTHTMYFYFSTIGRRRDNLQKLKQEITKPCVLPHLKRCGLFWVLRFPKKSTQPLLQYKYCRFFLGLRKKFSNDEVLMEALK